jgi:molybdopterin adenylyltransferase
VNAAVLTVSDGVAAGTRADESGGILADRVASIGFAVVERRVVSDDVQEISDALLGLTEQADLILTTGGTGFSPRDVTPEATSGVIERSAPGLDEAMREVSRRASPHGLLTRGASGIAGRTLIINFPGSPKACAECFDAVAGALGHAVALLTEQPTEHP